MKMLEISDLECRGLYYLCSENKGAVQMRDFRAADLRLCFRICKKRFSHDAAQIKSHCNYVNKFVLIKHLQ